MSIEFYDPSDVGFKQTLLSEIEFQAWDTAVRSLVVEGRERFHLFTDNFDGTVRVVRK